MDSRKKRKKRKKRTCSCGSLRFSRPISFKGFDGALQSKNRGLDGPRRSGMAGKKKPHRNAVCKLFL